MNDAFQLSERERGTILHISNPKLWLRWPFLELYRYTATRRVEGIMHAQDLSTVIRASILDTIPMAQHAYHYRYLSIEELVLIGKWQIAPIILEE